MQKEWSVELYKPVSNGGETRYVVDRVYSLSEAKPISDRDIARLPMNERANIIRDRQKDYWRPLLKRENALFYEGEREESWRFLESIFDIQLKDKEQRIHKTRATEIIKETAIDAFIKDFLLVPDSNERISIAIQDVITHTGYDNQFISNALNIVIKRFDSQISDQQIRYLNYKNVPGNIYNTDQSRVLGGLISYAHNEHGIGQTASALQVLSTRLLETYWRNIYDLYDNSEKHPILAFAHDYFYAASLTPDANIFIERSGWLVQKMESRRKSVIREIESASEIKMHEDREFQTKLSIAAKKIYPNKDFFEVVFYPGEEVLAEVKKQTPQGISVGIMTDRLKGLKAVYKILANRGLSKLFEEIMSSSARWTEPGKDLTWLLADHWSILYNNRFGITDLYRLVSAHASLEDLGKQADEVEHNSVLKMLEETAGMPANLGNRQYIIKSLSDDEGEKTTRRPDIVVSQLPDVFFLNQRPESSEQIKKIREENEMLTNKIRDENKWFVALNGDQFDAKINHDLDSFLINSLLFTPENYGKAGHKISIVSTISNKKREPYVLNLFMDRNGGITFTDSPNSITSHKSFLALQNFLLKRLNFITSGALSQGDIEIINDGVSESEDDNEVWTRRAHFRYLTSSLNRKYTLQSAEAKAHAEFVYQRYGIDLIQENLRRRRAKTLGENQVITFVREVNKGYAPPNNLVYSEIMGNKE